MKRQANALAATLQNTEMLADAYATAEDSAGSAMREQKNFEKGIQYSLDRFKATGQTALMDIIGSGPVKGVVDTGNVLLGVLDKIIDKTGLLGPALAAGLAVFTRRSGSGLWTYDQANNQMSGLLPNMIRGGKEAKKEGNASFIGGAFQTFTGRRGQRATSNAFYTNLFEQITGTGAFAGNQKDIDSIDWVAAEKAAGGIDKLDVAHKNLREDVEKSNITQAEFYSQVAAGKQATMPMADALKSFGKSMLTNVGQMGIMMAASAALSLAMEAISKKTITFDEAREGTRSLISNYQQARDEVNENIKSVDALKDEYDKLAQGVDFATNQNVSLSDDNYERYLDISNQIASMFPDMVSGYDAQGNAIIKLTDNVLNLTDAYKKARIEAANTLIKGDEEAGTGFATFAQDYLNRTSQTQATNTSAGVFSRIQGRLEQFGHNITGKYEVGIDTTAKDMRQSLEKALADPKKLLKEYNSEIFRPISQEDVENLRSGAKSMADIGKPAMQAFQDLKGVLNVSDKELVDILSDTKKWSENVDTIESQLSDVNASLAEAENNARNYLQAYATSLDTYYDKMDEDGQTLVNTMMANMPKEVIDSLIDSDVEVMADNYENLARNIEDALVSNQGYVNSLNNITRLLHDSDNLTVTNVAQIVSELKGLDGVIEGLSSQSLSEIFGADEAIDTAIRFEHQIKDLGGASGELREELNGLNTAEQKLFLNTVTDNADVIKNNTDALRLYKEALIEARHAEGEVGAHTFQTDLGTGSQYETATTAASSDVDYGKTYAGMKSLIDTAEELNKTHDTGTEAFKSIAGMFDEYGRTDTEAWADNLKTLNKYFKDTEHSTQGMINFLNDLKDAGYASYAEETDQWTLALEDLNAVADALGIGKEPLMALLDELQAKGYNIEHFDNLEDGYQRVGELQAQVNAEQARYDALVASGAPEEKIEAQKQKVDELKSSLEAAESAVEGYSEAAKEAFEVELLTAQNQATAAQDTANEIISGKNKEGQTLNEAQISEAKYSLLSQRDSLQKQVNDMALKYGAEFDINDEAFKGLKDQIDSLNTDLQTVFGKDDYEIQTSFTSEDLEGLNGETAADMSVNANIVNLFGEVNSADDLFNDNKLDNHDVYHNTKEGQSTQQETAQNKTQRVDNHEVYQGSKDWLTQRQDNLKQWKYDRQQNGLLGRWRQNYQENGYTPLSYRLQDRFDTYMQNRQPQGVINPATMQPIGQTQQGQQIQSELVLNTDQYDQSMEDAENKGKWFDGSIWEALTKVDDQATPELDSTMTQANVLNGFTAMIHTLAQDNANPVLQELDAFLQGLDGDNATVETVANDNATPILDFVRGVVDGLSGDSATVDLNATDGVSPVAQQAQSAVEGIGGTDIPLTADSSTGVAAANELSSAIDGVQPKTVTINAITSGLEAVQSLRSAIAGVVGKSVRVVTNFVTKHTTEATGTLNGFAGGTIRAFASGSRVSIDRDQDAIVNELGE